MNHNHGARIEPEDLLAFVDGEAPPDLAALIRGCPACAATAQGYAHVQRDLRQALHRFDCPTPQRLGEYDLGLLATAERVAIAGHVRGCPHCAVELRTLREFLAAETVLEPTLRERLRRVAARLVPQHAAGQWVGVRGAEAQARLYEADSLVIALDIAPAGAASRGAVSGLVTDAGDDPDRLPGRPVRVVSADGATRETQVDDIGGFAVERLSAGVYSLELELPDQVIVVEGVSVP